MAQAPHFPYRSGSYWSGQIPPTAGAHLGSPAAVFSDGAAANPQLAPSQASPSPEPASPVSVPTPETLADNTPNEPKRSLLRRAFSKAGYETAKTKIKSGFLITNNFDNAHPWALPTLVGAVLGATMVATGTYTQDAPPLALAEVGLVSVGSAFAVHGAVDTIRAPTIKKIALAFALVIASAAVLPHAAPLLEDDMGMSPTDPFVRAIAAAGTIFNKPKPVVARAQIGDILKINPGGSLRGITNMFDENNKSTDPNKLIDRFFGPDYRFQVVGRKMYGAYGRDTENLRLQLIDKDNNPIVDPPTGKTIFYTNSAETNYTIERRPAPPAGSVLRNGSLTPVPR